MEKRSNIVLRHKKTGMYYGRDLENTKSLFKAWRFYDAQQLDVWLSVSIYTPKHQSDYEPVEVEITIAEKGDNE